MSGQDSVRISAWNKKSMTQHV